MSTNPAQRRVARNTRFRAATPPNTPRKPPITVERITAAALEIVVNQGFDALTMRRIAALLDTGPASLYAHVVNKADLDELIIGRLCSQMVLPYPNPVRWREQISDVCAQLRDQYLMYPGISRAALAMAATDLDVLRVNEAMLAILITGGVEAQAAAWAIDSLFLYISAYTLEIAMITTGQRKQEGNWPTDQREREKLRRRFTALPADRFPQTSRYASELTSGTGHERYQFTVNLIIENLSHAAADGCAAGTEK